MSWNPIAGVLRVVVLLCLVILSSAFWSSLALQAQTAKADASNTSERASEPAIKNVFWQPKHLQQGSVAFITVELNRAAVRVSGRWIGKTLTFFRLEDPKIWYALAGADLEAQPGSQELAVNAVLGNGKRLHMVKPVDLAPGDFKTGAAEVPEQYVEPDAAQKREIARDDVLKKRAYEHLTPRPLWSGDFIRPVKGEATPSFGESRILNEEMTSTHRGTDFEVKEGTPVLVSNSGTVVLARELFNEGGCVIVDHGERFFTIYMHLSKIEAHVGERLKKGTQIGLSGATGRVSGPHLHMGVRWNDAYLDPVQLLTVTLPKTDIHKSR